jgi:hypothetical protein
MSSIRPSRRPRCSIIERALAVGSAIVWLVVFVLLAITEILSLVWLGDGAGPGDSGLATFAVITIALALAGLIMAPALYLFMPVMLPLDLLPHGLKKAVAPKLARTEGRGFVKVLLTELEGAFERAVEKAEAEEATETAPGVLGDGEPPPPRRPACPGLHAPRMSDARPKIRV